MRIPRDPPALVDLFPQHMEAALQVQPDIVMRLNNKYIHWDTLQHRSDLGALAPETVWAALKVARLSTRQELPFSDTAGQPFWFTLPPRAMGDLHRIDQRMGGVLASEYPGLSSAHREQYLINALMEDAIASSQLEGAATTRQVAKEMLRRNRPPRNDSERMILNNYRTISWLRKQAKTELTPQLVHQVCQFMTAGTLDDESDASRLRGPDDIIRVVDVYGEVMHTPPPPDELPQRLEALCNFANEPTDAEDAQLFIHPVIRAIITHFWLAYDHPYVDGNGRTARALFYWTMLRNDYWLFEYLPISRIIRDSAARYSRAFLESEHDGGDLTYFIMYNLRAIGLAERDLRAYLQAKQRESEQARRMLRVSEAFNYRQRELLMQAIRDSSTTWTVEQHAHKFGVTAETARRDLYDLERRGLLRRFKIGRAYAFEPTQQIHELVR